jgi:hypothetical protein
MSSQIEKNSRRGGDGYRPGSGHEIMTFPLIRHAQMVTLGIEPALRRMATSNPFST